MPTLPRAAGYHHRVVDDGTPEATRGVGLVEREALLARLRDNADVPVLVVQAGAGFGKTTLASQWVQRYLRPHLLVRIAPFLDDPAALAFALVDAFESIGPVAGETRAVVTGAEPGFRPCCFRR